ncbi:hypothetical protein G6F57_014192 [Rhizopus arrhizus]|nr:hypothetical protein G6F57_014192 [Rhizopus arrhizus]
MRRARTPVPYCRCGTRAAARSRPCCIWNLPANRRPAPAGTLGATRWMRPSACPPAILWACSAAAAVEPASAAWPVTACWPASATMTTSTAAASPAPPH